MCQSNEISTDIVSRMLFVVVEYVVRALLEGDVEASYTEADNASVVATDTGTAVAIITSPSYTLLITL